MNDQNNQVNNGSNNTTNGVITPNIVSNENPINNENQKKEKKKKIFGEIKAFFILIIIIGACAFGGWYWYTHIYEEKSGTNTDNSTNNQENNNVTGTLVSYSTQSTKHTLDKVGNYLVETYEGKLYKLMDLETNVLFEGKFSYTSYYLGDDNELYFILDEDAENENQLSLYKVKDNKMVEDKTYGEVGVYYSLLLEENDDATILRGVVCKKALTDSSDISDKVVLLDGTSKDVPSSYFLAGLSGRKEDSSSIIMSSDDEIIVESIESENITYGIYSLSDNEVIIDTNYDYIEESSNDTYVVLKDGKYGIIDKELKKLMEFEYDYIEYVDNYYIFINGGKIAIYDKDLKQINNFDVDYTGDTTKYQVISKKIGNCYIIAMNDDSKIEVIKSDGTKEEIITSGLGYDENTGLIYSKSNQVYTIYDEDMKKKYDIDLSSYDYGNNIYLTLINEKTIGLGVNCTDKCSSYKLYFDYETGEKLDEVEDYSNTIKLSLGEITYTYNYKNNKLKVGYGKDEKEFTENFSYLKLDNGLYFSEDLYINVIGS